MNRLCNVLMVILLCLGCSKTQAQPNPPEKGWLWYKEEKVKPKPKPKQEEKKPSSASPKAEQLSATQIMQQKREEFEELLSAAALEPTLDNVTLVKNKQLEFENKSSQFADYWVLSHLMDSKGYSHGGNPNPWHREIAQKEREEKLGEQLKQVSKKYGLFFAFKQSCPYCHKFAPVVARFAEKYNFEIKGISVDGGTLAGIANISKDNGALSVINPDGIYPALFLANPQTMEVIPIAWGMVTTEQLLNNMEAVLKQKEMKL